MKRLLLSLLLTGLFLLALVQGFGKGKSLPSNFIKEKPTAGIYGNSVTALVTDTSGSTYANIPRISCASDKDGDGINDLYDIVEGARKDADNMPVYKSEYYQGGYPPDSEGVCTDVIWRAFKNAGYNLKDMVDRDIKEHIKDYPGVDGKPDPNIDFRRVKNLYVFFKKYAARITTEIKPYDADNLGQWQGGDIVTFGSPEHIAIVSDKRRKDGIPYLIHNSGPYTAESDSLMTWMPGITGHFRFMGK